jgi:hypothetical protein
MALDMPTQIRETLEKLTGQTAPLKNDVPVDAGHLLDLGGTGIGLSQLNELLLLLGYDRVTRAFFQYLVDGAVQYEPTATATIPTYSRLVDGVDRFRQTALFLYGNVKYAFKTLSSDEELLVRDIANIAPIEVARFSSRHAEIFPIQKIEPDNTYYLGYIVAAEIQERLAAGDQSALLDEQKQQHIVEVGIRNHNAYLVSDHLDVYVATSMRSRHDYVAVSRLVNAIFQQPALKELKLRYFDPTQAYCKRRVDKGLVEALMLRRACCTIYLAQENDTFGKDSELASTLAQGKTVVAYVPSTREEYAQDLVDEIQQRSPNRSRADIVLEQLRIFDPEAGWTDRLLQQWIADPTTMVDEAAIRMLSQKIAKHYDKRAGALMALHPLGIQVHLETGVANGVLVVRTPEKCAELVRRIMTQTLQFDLVEEDGLVVLREQISGCIFRVMTQDPMLTNSFWNFYLTLA